MNLTKCDNGHFYDADKYDVCPHCGGATTPNAVSVSQTSPKQISLVQEEKSETMMLNKSFLGWKKKKTKPEVEHINPATMSPRTTTPEPQSVQPMSQIKSPEPHMEPDSTPLASAVAAAVVDKDDIKTVGYFSSASGIEPVVGWLVAIDGPAYGLSYTLHSGKNAIGRASTMDVVIVQDNKVSRERHTTIMYEPQGRKFYLLSGESNGMVYYNDEILLENRVLNLNDKIKVGDSQLVFIPFCGPEFTWDEE